MTGFYNETKRKSLLEDVDVWQSEHILFEDILLCNIKKIILVDWEMKVSLPMVLMILSSSTIVIGSISQVFWKTTHSISVPDDLLFLENHDKEHLSSIPKKNQFNIKDLLQLALLPSYLESAPVWSVQAHKHQKLLPLSLPYVYECFNLCSNISSYSWNNILHWVFMAVHHWVWSKPIELRWDGKNRNEANLSCCFSQWRKLFSEFCMKTYSKASQSLLLTVLNMECGQVYHGKQSNH